eukprot:gene4434-4689_t
MNVPRWSLSDSQFGPAARLRSSWWRGVSTPGDNGTTDLRPDGLGVKVYSTESTTEQYIDIPWDFVLTPFHDVMLAAPDLAVMKDIYQSCCLAARSGSPLCSEYLPAAIAPEASADADICHLSPLTCNGQGQLTRLAVAAAGLNCPRGLPSSLVNLTALVTLDLAFNALNNTVAEVASIIGNMPALENAFLRYTGIRGPVSCDLVKSRRVTRLSLSGNNVTGSLPACMLQSPSLQELYLSQTWMSGTLPDAVPSTSPLRDPSRPRFLLRPIWST